MMRVQPSTMTIDEIDAEIAMWERRLRKWRLMRDFRDGDNDYALRGAWACEDEIKRLRRQRLVLTEQTERK